MPETTHEAASDHEEHGPVAQEASDIQPKYVARTFAVFAALVVTVIVVLAVMVGWLREGDRQAMRPLTAAQRADVIPPEPRLLANPDSDIAALRDREDIALSTWAWLTPDRTRARVPLATAQDLMLGRGLDDALP